MRLIGPQRFVFILAVVLVSFASVGVRADYPNRILDDQPLGYWRFNEQREPTAHNSGTAGAVLDGAYVGGESGAPGPSELFDGTPILGLERGNIAVDIGENAYIGIEASPLSGLTEFSMTGWFRIRDLDQDRVGLFGQNDTIEFGFIQPNQLQLWTAQGGSVNWQFDPATEVPDESWFYVAAVGDGEALNLYLNGVHVQSGGTPITESYGSSNFPFRIGGGGIFDPTGNHFRGTLDEIAIWDFALSADQIMSHFEAALSAGMPGDFNGNGRLDVDDVSQLERAIFEGSTDIIFDVDGDEVIDEDDLFFWVNDLAATWFGDANLDGQFNSSDFVQVLTIGKYEDSIPLNATWDEGDWNADLEFDSQDLVAALTDGGYEIGAAVPVPEPSSQVVWLISASLLIARRRRRP